MSWASESIDEEAAEPRPPGGPARRRGRAAAASRSSRARSRSGRPRRRRRPSRGRGRRASPILRPGRVGDDVDVRAADGVERPLRQLGPRLAPGDVDRRDDDVEAGEQVVVVVERAVGADLELAAVEQAEALGRGRRRAPCRPPPRAANRALSVGDDRRPAPRPGRGSGRGRSRATACGRSGPGRRSRGARARLGHDLDRLVAVGPVGVAVQVAAQVGQRRSSAGSRPASAASISPRSSRSSGSMNGRPRKAYASASVANVRSSAVVAGQRLAVLADPQEALLGQAPAPVAGHRAQPDVVLLRAGEVDPVGARPRPAA